MEPTEIQEFSNHLKEANEGSESLTRISLAISILAVLVAMVTVLGHRSHTEAVLSEARASDQWNQYQAKKIRNDRVSGEIVLLSLQPSTNVPAVQNQIMEDRKQQTKLKNDLAEEEARAKELEDGVDHAEHQAARYDLGEALLQIAVVLCSITLFTRRRLYFFAGLTLGAAGLLFAASALFVR